MVPIGPLNGRCGLFCNVWAQVGWPTVTAMRPDLGLVYFFLYHMDSIIFGDNGTLFKPMGNHVVPIGPYKRFFFAIWHHHGLNLVGLLAATMCSGPGTFFLRVNPLGTMYPLVVFRGPERAVFPICMELDKTLGALCGALLQAFLYHQVHFPKEFGIWLENNAVTKMAENCQNCMSTHPTPPRQLWTLWYPFFLKRWDWGCCNSTPMVGCKRICFAASYPAWGWPWPI